jgi:hypothetical protein
VAAAAVLLVDWLQRRSAVKAGTEAGDATPTPPAAPVPPPHMLGGEPAVEPATEVIPTVRADGRYDTPGSEPVVGSRHDERPDTRETVVLRAFPPSGSTGGPSGAIGGISHGGPNLSQSVTKPGGDASDADRNGGSPTGAPVDGRDTTAPDADPDSETIKVAGAAGRDAPGQGAPDGLPQRGGPDGPGAPPALPPLGPDGAPPEEPRDADAAALVAELDDEVVVVDELPRYHLGGCRSLGGSPLIPLPIREAVELGFTPCAWCTPDRSLAARHRAPVR